MKKAPLIGRVLCLAGAILLLAAWKPGDGAVITAGHEAYFTANVDERAIAACGWRPDGVGIQAKEVIYKFIHEGSARATVKLSHPSTCNDAVKALFCVSAVLDRGAGPGGRCGVAFLRSMIRDGIGKNPRKFSWFAVRAKKGRQPSARRRAPSPSDPLTRPEVQLYLLSGLMTALLVAMVISLWRTRPWRALSVVEAAALVTCLATAAASRLALEPFPADVWLSTSQGLWFLGMNHWAPAYSAMLHLVFGFFPATLDTAGAVNVLLSCATVGVVYAFVSLYFDDRKMAFASAAVLALQPISIRYAASDSQHVLTTLTLFLALMFTTLWIRRGGYLWALQAAGWLAVSANTRDEALIGAGAVICVLGALAVRHSPRATLRQLLVSALLGLAAMAYPAWDAISTLVMQPKIGSFRPLGIVESPFLLSPYSPQLVVLLAGLGGVVVLTINRYQRKGLWWLTAMVLVASPTIYITHPGWEHTHRHCLPSLAMYAVFAGVGLGWLIGRLDIATCGIIRAATRQRLFPALALGLVALAALPNLGFLTRTWSHELEFKFLRANLGRVKSGCTVVGIKQPSVHVGLNLFRALSAEVGRDHYWMEPAELLDSTEPLPACAVFIESASCHASHSLPASASDGMFPDCAAIKERYVLQPLARTTIPALPYIGEVYTADPIPLAIHRILGRKPPRDRRRRLRGRRTASE